VSAELGWPVEIGMRDSEPSVERGLGALAELGVSEVAAIILSPQYSPMLMGGYARAIDAARSTLGPDAPDVIVAGAWYEEPAFIGALAERITTALGSLSQEGREATRVLMTAHSLPKTGRRRGARLPRPAACDRRSVGQAAGLDGAAWMFCWQSAGHEPGEWMTPDFADLMPAIATAGWRGVLVVPVQFLADHLETVYDIDVGAREEAERAGLRFSRIPSLGVDGGLVRALAAAARRTLAVPVNAG
jgi:ferrochelatase